MQINKQWLDEHDACDEGRTWFNEHFPEGGRLSEVLKALRDDAANMDPGDHDSTQPYGWATWLMSKVSAEVWDKITSASALAAWVGMNLELYKITWLDAKLWCIERAYQTFDKALALERLDSLIADFMAAFKEG